MTTAGSSSDQWWGSQLAQEAAEARGECPDWCNMDHSKSLLDENHYREIGSVALSVTEKGGFEAHIWINAALPGLRQPDGIIAETPDELRRLALAMRQAADDSDAVAAWLEARA